MTKEEILALPAGRSLDLLVAEKVMGWGKWVWSKNGYEGWGPGWNWENKRENSPHVVYWRPSDDLNYAFLVVKELTENKANSDFNLSYDCGEPPQWLSGWYAYFPGPTDAVAPTPALAICRAALLAVLSTESK